MKKRLFHYLNLENYKEMRVIIRSFLILLFLGACRTKSKKATIFEPYKRSTCIGYRELSLTKKQIALQGKAAFGGYTDYDKRFGKEFKEEVLVYFKKGAQPFGCILNEEINNNELLDLVKPNGKHLIITIDLKTAKIFDVPILHLPQGGWEIVSDYLFMIKNLHIKKVYKDICEEEIISLLKSGEL